MMLTMLQRNLWRREISLTSEMAKEASENSAGRIPRSDKDLVQQNRSRSPSPTGSDASDHSLHSLQGRINRIERGQAEPASQEDGDDQEAIVYFDNEEDLTDVPLAQANEDQDFLEFIAKSRQLDPVEMETEVQTNIDKLLAQKRREKRDSATISGDMIRECQDLLRLFGIPYITAPMEAESQCAWLTNAKLVDGIITDDSDVFLFGGSTVYKNMFNSNKFVQCYRQERILSHLGLEREHLILLAYLLGSDYTEGIDGVGVVSGMEIMNEFCKVETKPGMKNEDYLKGLEEFKEWVILVQRGLDRKLEASPMRKKFKSKAKNLELPQDFPDHRVFGAYILPEVNESMDAFQWGSPNIEGIRNFMEDKAGYPTKKTNEILVPVIHEMDKRLRAPVQTRLDQFFLLGNSPTKMSSKRLQCTHSKMRLHPPISIAPRGGKSGRGSRRGGKQQVKARIKLPVAKRAPKKPIQIDSDSSSSGTD
ncbi:hypothetical protein BDR26DRAFT_224872 [Obelidium mucronatum]|nr:hypothetical protein BDR26DRAFT_224872 [Obelidium mucronatum]